MRLYEKTIQVTMTNGHEGLLPHLEAYVVDQLGSDEIPVRLAVTKTDNKHYDVELGIIADAKKQIQKDKSIFSFKRRQLENVDLFNAVLVIPTGIGAELGGHSGDGGPLARLMASICDNLITHPNVVNASDINELPHNGLYVEGSVISRFLMGTVGLQKVRSNRMILVIDDHDDCSISEHAINAASAARASLGLDCPLVVKMDEKIKMYSEYSPSGRAVGRIDDLEKLFEVLKENRLKYDAIALSSTIRVPKHYHQDYYLGDLVNPWGGVEAMLTHAVSMAFEIPSAHAPMMESQDILNLNVGVVDPRMAAEVVSVAYLHCILKGLQRSPRIITDEATINHSSVISVNDISCLVIPDGCIGLPTLAALEQGIPVIAVKENKNLMKNNLSLLPFESGKLFIVDNYLEALGVMCALQAGVPLEAVQRPLEYTNVIPELRREIVEEYRNIVKFRAR